MHQLWIRDTPLTQFEYNSVKIAINKSSIQVNCNVAEQNIYFNGKEIDLVSSKNIRIYLQKMESSCDIEIEKKTIWSLISTVTNEARLIELQWKILHRIYPTNVLLYKMKLSESELCTSCQELDTLEHFFCKCGAIMAIWAQVEKLNKNYIGKNNWLTDQIKMEGVPKSFFQQIRLGSYEFKYTNLTIIIAKLSINKFKFGQYPNLLILFERELHLRGL